MLDLTPTGGWVLAGLTASVTGGRFDRVSRPDETRRGRLAEEDSGEYEGHAELLWKCEFLAAERRPKR